MKQPLLHAIIALVLLPKYRPIIQTYLTISWHPCIMKARNDNTLVQFQQPKGCYWKIFLRRDDYATRISRVPTNA